MLKMFSKGRFAVAMVVVMLVSMVFPSTSVLALQPDDVSGAEDLLSVSVSDEINYDVMQQMLLGESEMDPVAEAEIPPSEDIIPEEELPPVDDTVLEEDSPAPESPAPEEELPSEGDLIEEETSSPEEDPLQEPSSSEDGDSIQSLPDDSSISDDGSIPDDSSIPGGGETLDDGEESDDTLSTNDASAGTYGPYHAGDVAVINAMIVANGLHLNKWESGNAPPLNWNGHISWTEDETEKRIQELQFMWFELTALDVTGLDALVSLNCLGNKLTELDLSNVPGLTTLNCSDNELTALDLTAQPALTTLSCSDNPIGRLQLYGGYDLNLEILPENSGTVSLTRVAFNGNLDESPQISVGVSATPEEDFVFSKWTRSDLSGAEITVNPWVGPTVSSGSVTITANFETAPLPVINITSQPAASLQFVAGNISGRLSVEASLSISGLPGDRAKLNYQWYSSQTGSDADGVAIPNAVGSSLVIPKSLEVGTYYYYCAITAKNAELVTTNMAEISVVQGVDDTQVRQADTLQALKDAISEAPADGTVTTIEIKNDIALDAELSIAEGKNIKLWSDTPVTLKAADGARLFTVQGNLTLENHITLQGTGEVPGNGGGVYISGGGFTMNGGIIKGNSAKARETAGGGVYVDGQFTMNGGEISGNTTAIYGSGVYVSPTSSFIMAGGVISGNTGASYGAVYIDNGAMVMSGGEISGNAGNLGGGVSVVGGTFDLHGGKIKNNTVALDGGGVYLTGAYDTDAGLFDNAAVMTMDGGEISGNAAERTGGGVHVAENGSFVLTDGKISTNEAPHGGGVSSTFDGVFTMNGGEISDNTSLIGNGGGVECHFGSFIMKNGTICRNKSANNGGGVYVFGVPFALEGGKITGNTAEGNGAGIFHQSNDDSIFTMKNGEISGNISSSDGGGIYAVDMVLENGSIRGNTARRGGGIGSALNFTMNGGEIIGNTTMSDFGHGGGVLAKAATINNGKINENKASGVNSDGGGIFCESLNMTGGEICDNEVEYCGGGVALEKGESQITGATISGNNAYVGGGIYQWLGTLSIGENTIITANSGALYGGGMCVYDGEIKLNGGEVSGNDARYGGGVAVSEQVGEFEDAAAGFSHSRVYTGTPQYGSKLTMTAGEITGNMATVSGGGVNIRNTEARDVAGQLRGICEGEMTLSGGNIAGNTAPKGRDAFNRQATLVLRGGKLGTPGVGGFAGEPSLVTGPITVGSVFVVEHTRGSVAQGSESYTLAEADAAFFMAPEGCRVEYDAAGNGTIKVIDPSYVFVTNVVLNKSNVLLAVGQGYTLLTTISPANASSPVIEWKTGDPKIALVSRNGVVTAVAAGTTTITATAVDDDRIFATCTVTVAQPVTGVKLSITSKTLKKGESVTLTPTISPSNAANKNVSWSSSNTAVATVSSTGKVTATGKGTATITVKTVDGKKTATCKITVTQPVTKITLSPTVKTDAVGKTVTITPTVTPGDANNIAVTWKSSNTAIATVSSNGVVKGIKNGRVTITATAKDGSGKTATVTIYVGASVTGVTLNTASTQVVIGKTTTIKTTIAPSNAANKTVTWTSSNTAVATVSSSGVVKGIKAGTVTITATTQDGKKIATCKVRVGPLATGISVSPKVKTVRVGSITTLKATVVPSNAAFTAVTWKSSDTTIATVSSSGVVKGIKNGRVTITATAKDGSGKTATVTIYVGASATGVTLNATSKQLVIGKTTTIKATVAPSNAANKTVTWTSSNTAVATVSSSGVVKGIKAGTVTITATTQDGKKIATCKVRVGSLATGITVSPKVKTVRVGSTTTLKATVAPSNAAFTAVTWKSSNTAIATVSSSGVVKGIKNGRVTITATAKDGSGKTATVTIYVGAAVSGVSMNTTARTVKIGATYALKATVAPSAAANKTVIWTSSDKTIATVSSSGVVTGIRAGRVTITTKTQDGGKVATCVVTVP